MDELERLEEKIIKEIERAQKQMHETNFLEEGDRIMPSIEAKPDFGVGE